MKGLYVDYPPDFDLILQLILNLPDFYLILHLSLKNIAFGLQILFPF